MLRIFAFVFLFVLTGSVVAQDDGKYLQGKVIQGPYKTTVVEGGDLSFLETGDAEFPVSLVLDVMSSDGSSVRALVDKYDVAGSAPKIESIFFYPVKGKKNVLVLISWELTSRGVGTYGTLYQVYGYGLGAKSDLVTNKLIRFDKHLSGIDGYQEGEEQKFAYKDAVSIKAYIKKYKR
jgi:hypothetical protein